MSLFDGQNSVTIRREKIQLFTSPTGSDRDTNNDDTVASRNSISKRSRDMSSSFQTALCIVPPEHKWDTIQRARHFAEDKTYRQWPPAIRLFHPFCERDKLTDFALDVAKIVEAYNVEPFKITLNRWTVMPLPDTLQSLLQEQEKGNISTDDSGFENGATYKDDPHYKKTQALIASEERKGRVRKRIRDQRLQERQRAKAIATAAARANNTQVLQEQQEDPNVAAMIDREDSESRQSESETIQPRTTFDEFNGPSMIAIEPDEESSQKLIQLRELIKSELLEQYGPNSVSDSTWDTSLALLEEEDAEVSPEVLEEYLDEIMMTSFRPLVPIGAYPTVDAALATARKLKGFWDPLSFTVTDLHFISLVKSSGQKIEESTETYYSLNFDQTHSPETVVGTPFHDTKTQQIRETGAAFGCDAIVMLMGEELEMDDEGNELLANLVWEEGIPGGFRFEEDGMKSPGKPLVHDEVPLEEDEIDDDKNSDDQPYSRYGTYGRKLDSKEGDYEELLAWLDGDDDDEDSTDEIGTDVVIGRTHMFSGEKRMYTGMPASSTAEEADGSLGLGIISDGEL